MHVELKTASEQAGEGQLVRHAGGCHCRSVRFEVDAPADLVVWDCNCSICAMKRNTHFIVPSTRFHLQKGSGKYLSNYQFNTGVAKHLFCKVCGICSFYVPRSNPDGYAVTVHCLDPGTVRSVTIHQADGQNWEQFMANSDIRKFSKD
ncbi:hypothetical protein KFL_003510060 [Klebsormidium nitens]|uniref:CENP-V/GFA domain-containing protein n=1 Tax=Klebsormidium nitens TaxID=105231 RepID=A0A1Y1IBR6_KLENI|nr:hypothetical protein KFL_003510060 [Klebsormidium nitens]|eukprot:GAQ87412.1 hypothetical protein KFL_003510060 [Klebsormidium nitens]